MVEIGVAFAIQNIRLIYIYFQQIFKKIQHKIMERQRFTIIIFLFLFFQMKIYYKYNNDYCRTQICTQSLYVYTYQLSNKINRVPIIDNTWSSNKKKYLSHLFVLSARYIVHILFLNIRETNYSKYYQAIQTNQKFFILSYNIIFF